MALDPEVRRDIQMRAAALVAKRAVKMRRRLKGDHYADNFERKTYAVRGIPWWLGLCVSLPAAWWSLTGEPVKSFLLWLGACLFGVIFGISRKEVTSTRVRAMTYATRFVVGFVILPSLLVEVGLVFGCVIPYDRVSTEKAMVLAPMILCIIVFVTVSLSPAVPWVRGSSGLSREWF